jgi:hypothetical protein
MMIKADNASGSRVGIDGFQSPMVATRETRVFCRVKVRSLAHLEQPVKPIHASEI